MKYCTVECCYYDLQKSQGILFCHISTTDLYFLVSKKVNFLVQWIVNWFSIQKWKTNWLNCFVKAYFLTREKSSVLLMKALWLFRFTFFIRSNSSRKYIRTLLSSRYVSHPSFRSFVFPLITFGFGCYFTSEKCIYCRWGREGGGEIQTEERI